MVALTEYEKKMLKKVSKYRRDRILELTEAGDVLWAEGYRLDGIGQAGEGDHCKAKGNGKYAEADKIYLKGLNKKGGKE